MKFLFADNIRKLRTEHNLTQADLAGFLGISPQSVSKRECNDGLPDITMLPVIASYFSVSIDELLWKPLTNKDEKIKMYVDEYDRLRIAGSMDAAVSLATQAYKEYPYDWNIITIYCNSLTRAYTEHPGEKMSELRSLCKMVIDKCTDTEARKFATYCMLFAEDDDKIDFWFKQVPETYDFTYYERLEDRYKERGKTVQYLNQKHNNIYALYTHIDDKLAKDIKSAEDGIIIEKQRFDIAKALLHGIGGFGRIAIIGIGYSAALFANGKIMEGYEILEESLSMLKNDLSVPDGTEMTFEGGISEYSYVKCNNSNAQRKQSALQMLKKRKDCMFYGFESVRTDKKFKQLVYEIESFETE